MIIQQYINEYKPTITYNSYTYTSNDYTNTDVTITNSSYDGTTKLLTFTIEYGGVSASSSIQYTLTSTATA